MADPIHFIQPAVHTQDPVYTTTRNLLGEFALLGHKANALREAGNNTAHDVPDDLLVRLQTVAATTATQLEQLFKEAYTRNVPSVVAPND